MSHPQYSEQQSTSEWESSGPQMGLIVWIRNEIVGIFIGTNEDVCECSVKEVSGKNILTGAWVEIYYDNSQRVSRIIKCQPPLPTRVNKDGQVEVLTDVSFAVNDDNSAYRAITVDVDEVINFIGYEEMEAVFPGTFYRAWIYRLPDPIGNIWWAVREIGEEVRSEERLMSIEEELTRTRERQSERRTGAGERDLDYFTGLVTGKSQGPSAIRDRMYVWTPYFAQEGVVNSLIGSLKIGDWISWSFEKQDTELYSRPNSTRFNIKEFEKIDAQYSTRIVRSTLSLRVTGVQIKGSHFGRVLEHPDIGTLNDEMGKLNGYRGCTVDMTIERCKPKGGFSSPWFITDVYKRGETTNNKKSVPPSFSKTKSGSSNSKSKKSSSFSRRSPSSDDWSQSQPSVEDVSSSNCVSSNAPSSFGINNNISSPSSSGMEDKDGRKMKAIVENTAPMGGKLFRSFVWIVDIAEAGLYIGKEHLVPGEWVIGSFTPNPKDGRQVSKMVHAKIVPEIPTECDTRSKSKNAIPKVMLQLYAEHNNHLRPDGVQGFVVKHPSFGAIFDLNNTLEGVPDRSSVLVTIMKAKKDPIDKSSEFVWAVVDWDRSTCRPIRTLERDLIQCMRSLLNRSETVRECMKKEIPGEYNALAAYFKLRQNGIN